MTRGLISATFFPLAPSKSPSPFSGVRPTAESSALLSDALLCRFVSRWVIDKKLAYRRVSFRPPPLDRERPQTAHLTTPSNPPSPHNEQPKTQSPRTCTHIPFSIAICLSRPSVRAHPRATSETGGLLVCHPRANPPHRTNDALNKVQVVLPSPPGSLNGVPLA